MSSPHLTDPETLARVGGWCRLCSSRIVAGEHYVSKLPRIGWVHSTCASGYRHVIAEHREDGALT
jgi:hypothetical protein